MPARPTRPRRRSTSSRKRIPRRAALRGVAAAEAALPPDDPAIAAATGRIREAGGAAIGAYRDPLSEKPLVIAVLPLSAVEPTPFQRELSPAHTKRLALKIEEAGSFLDPIIAVAAPGERFWTPNGRHRLAAARALGLKAITALVAADPQLAYKILALNTEKAHNLRDRSLEVIRMARALAADRGNVKESEFAAEFESAALLTLGILYQGESRFSGGAYLPMLRKVDRFDPAPTLRASLRSREGWAARLKAIDGEVTKIVKALQARGFKSPYLRALVVARINPVRWVRLKKDDTRPPMPVGEALTRMSRSVRDFDPASVRESELALVGAVASDEA